MEKLLIEIDEVPEKALPPVKLPVAIECLNFIYQNVHAGQHHKGAFNMEDCREFIKAKNLLIELFTEPAILCESENSTEEDTVGATIGTDRNKTEKIPEPRYAEQKHLDAYTVVLKGCSVIQSTGIFSMEGSVMILDRLELLSQELEKIKSPTLKMKQLVKKNADSRTTKKVPKK
jgi:hypothetical protein